LRGVEAAQNLFAYGFFGDGGDDGTVEVALEQFRGGARSVFIARLGQGGTVGTYTIKDNDDVDVIRLDMIYPGSRRFNLTIRRTLEQPDSVLELLILEGTTALERIRFRVTDTAESIVEAAERSNFFKLVKLDDITDGIALVNQVAITPGTNPASYTPTDYTNAFEALEPHRWSVLAIDSDTPSIHTLMQAYLNRIYQGGKFVMGVVGEPSTVDFDKRLENATAFNDYQIVYVGSGFTDRFGEKFEGWKAAARVAGMIAGTPSNESITHNIITGGIDLIEGLTNSQYEQSIRAGMVTFSLSSTKAIWIESGINTLTNPSDNNDHGWKKIKRVKVRFELMQRLNDAVERLVGNINNDPDGRMTIVQSGNGVCNAMVTEGKLLPGAYTEVDMSNTPEADSAWFLVYADDIDALEKMYFAFRFRFSPEIT